MVRKSMTAICCTVVLLLVSESAVGDHYWESDGARSSNDWDNPNHWFNNVTQVLELPGPDSYVIVGHESRNASIGPTLAGGTQVEIGYLNLSFRAYDDTDNMVTTIESGAELTAKHRIRVGMSPYEQAITVTLNTAGVVKTPQLSIGEAHTGNSEIPGGMGVVNLTGGVITVTDDEANAFQVNDRTATDKSYLDISGDGRLRLRGDWTDPLECKKGARLESYLNEGKITATEPVAAYLVEFEGDVYTEIAIGGSIQFEQTATGQYENASATAGVIVNVGRAQHDDVYTVDYAVTGGSAAAGEDYVLEAGTLTFGAGEVRKTIEIGIVQDTMDEDDDTIVLMLSNPTGPNARLGETTEHTFTIMDPRPVVGFEAGESSVPQNTKVPAKIAVTLSNDIFTETVTVDYAVTGGTATRGLDYQLADGTLTFQPGQTEKTIDITILDDGSYEDEDETIVLTLSNPAKSHPGDTLEHTLTILDPRVELGFVEAHSSESEVAGSAAIEVRLSGPTGDTISVDYAVNGGTATGGGVDYSLDAGTLVFAPGETSKFVMVETVDDGLDDGEADETLVIGLSDLSGELVSFGANMQHELTILNAAYRPDYLKVDFAHPIGATFGDLYWMSDSERSSNDWNDPANWIDANPNSIFGQHYLPSPYSYVIVGHESRNATVGPTITAGTEAEANCFNISFRAYDDTDNIVVTVESGASLVARSSVRIGMSPYQTPMTATLNTAGIITTRALSVGNAAGGGENVGGVGVCNIVGGAVIVAGDAETDLQITDRTPGEKSTVNISGEGMLLWAGDHASTVNDYIAAANIKADGAGALQVSVVDGYTAIRAFSGPVTLPEIPDLPEVDALPKWVAHPKTAKEDWWHWAAPRWHDLYRHDIVWERGESNFSDTDPSGIAGTGVHARLGVVYDGDMGLKVAGLAGYLAGDDSPSGTPIHDPICNSWVQAIDWAEYKWGTILLAFHNLPAGEYALHSYHNNFDCYRQGGSHVACDSTGVQQPNMPSITAMALAESEDLMDTLDPEFGDDVYNHYPYSRITRQNVDLGCGSGFELQQAAYDVPIQQVTSDDELIPSVVKFKTDGSPVLIVYENGCCVVDTVRPGREGGRAILNAFRLDLVRTLETGPVNPCKDTEEAAVDSELRWWPTGAQSYDVYFGPTYFAVDTATRVSPYYIGNVTDSLAGVDVGWLELNKNYYWRVDKVNPAGITKGQVWSFKTTACHVLEDFSSPWKDGFDPWYFWGAYGQAEVAYGCTCGDGVYDAWARMPDGCDPDYPGDSVCRPHHQQLDKILQLLYYNRPKWGSYSETGHVICPPDWSTIPGGLLTVTFRGLSANLPDRLYALITDASGNQAEAVIGESPDDLKIEQWQTHAVPLEQFAGIDLSRVAALRFGVGDRNGSPSDAYGTVYISDFKLCVGETPMCPCPGDLNEDGQVDLEDLQAVAGILLQAGSPFIVPVEEGDCGDLNTDLQIDLEDLQAVAGILLNTGSPFIVPCE